MLHISTGDDKTLAELITPSRSPAAPATTICCS